MPLNQTQREMVATRIDLSPVDVVIVVLEGEPSIVRLPITVDGVPVDIAVDYPNMVSRTSQGDNLTELPTTVEDTNVIVAAIPALEQGDAHWELRNTDEDRTWITAFVEVEPRGVPLA